MNDNKKVSTTKQTMLLAALGLASASAAAMPVSVSQTLSFSDLLNGGSKSLAFNVNSLLAAQGLESDEILSGTLVVYGISDINYSNPSAAPYSGYDTSYAGYHTVSYTYYVGGYYSCGTWSCYYSPASPRTGYYSVPDYDQVRSRDIRHIDGVADIMAVTAGASTVTDQADQTQHLVGNYGSATSQGEYGGGYNSTYRQYNRERNVYEAVFGELNTSMGLDSAALLDISADGILEALVGSPVGQFRLISATLNLVGEDVPDAAAVPEPSILGLAGMGLAAAAIARRRRRKV